MATVLNGSDEADTLTALNGSDHILRGYGGADLLTGADGDDTLLGGEGDDRLMTGGGDDSLNGGTGDDFFSLTGAGQVTAQGGSGDDRFDVLLPAGTEPGALVDGGSGVDEFRTADAQADYLVDLVNGVVTGHGASMGLIHVEIVHTEGGNDTLIGAGNSTLYAHGGDDQILMGSGGGAAYGGHGRDLVTGGGGGNLIYGGENADTVYGGGGNDTLSAALGSSGDPGLESLFGGLGHDEILGGQSAIGTVLSGDEGNDTLVSGALIGAGEQYFGGSGRDLANFGAAAAGGSFLLGTLGTVGFGEALHTLNGIEDLVMTGHDDWVQGSNAANRIEGGNGHDTIFGQGGDDSLFGGAGDDVIGDSQGLAQIFAGAGDDAVWLSGALLTGGVIDGGSGSADQIIAADDSVHWRVDLATGTATAAGRVQVLAGFEQAVGGGGHDTLTGSSGANVLRGGGGEDVLRGGAGVDTLFGGSEGDDFVFAPGDGGLAAAADVIADFGDGDRVDLTAFGGLVWRDAGAFVPGGRSGRRVRRGRTSCCRST
jgi:Ca2+-binding RTX toxin-like protein